MAEENKTSLQSNINSLIVEMDNYKSKLNSANSRIVALESDITRISGMITEVLSMNWSV